MDHLQFVNGIYRVRIVVPPPLRPIIGKESLVKSLGTGDYATATRRSTPYIAQFKTKLASARLGKHYHNNVKPRHFNGTDALSDSPEWFTPPIVFEAMAVEFDMDVASPGRDRVPWIPAREHLTRADDGLTAPWVGFVWLNPPYGLRNGMQKWIDRFVAHGNGVIMLPGYTYTRWFHDFVSKADCILFPQSKLQFINPALPPKRRNCTLSNVLGAMGETGRTALRNAAASGFGRLFEL
jgi:hypothetical protein